MADVISDGTVSAWWCERDDTSCVQVDVGPVVLHLSGPMLAQLRDELGRVEL